MRLSTEMKTHLGIDPVISPKSSLSNHDALMAFFAHAGYGEAWFLQECFDENFCGIIGRTLHGLLQSERIKSDRFDRVVEHLFVWLECPKGMSYARLYGLFSRCLGYDTYIDARQAINRCKGWLPVKTQGLFHLLKHFEPAVARTRNWEEL